MPYQSKHKISSLIYSAPTINHEYRIQYRLEVNAVGVTFQVTPHWPQAYVGRDQTGKTTSKMLLYD